MDAVVRQSIAEPANTTGALASFNSLTGQSIPASGPLSGAQLQWIIGNEIYAGGVRQTTYDTTAGANQAATDINQAYTFLLALRAVGNEDALALYNMSATYDIAASGALTSDQITELIGRMYEADGATHSAAYNNPATAVDDMAHAYRFLVALRAAGNEDALALYNLSTINDIAATGDLTPAQVTELVGRMYEADGTTHSAAYTDAATAVDDMAAAYRFLVALRAAGNEDALALYNLSTINDIAATGDLTPAQVTELVGRMYEADGTTHSAAYTDAAAAVDDMSHAYVFYTILIADADALALYNLSTANDITPGVDLTDLQVTELAGRMYEADGTTHSAAYNNPATAVDDMAAAYRFLVALRAVGNEDALALYNLSTVNDIAATGDLTPAQVTELVGRMYEADGTTHSAAYTDAAAAVDDMAHAYLFLVALRAIGNEDALALYNLSVTAAYEISATGDLTADQVTELVGRMYEADGTTHSAAYNDPTTAVDDMAAAYLFLIALRANADALALYNLSATYSIAATGDLTADQVTELAGRMYEADGTTHSVAYFDPATMLDDMGHAYLFYVQLQANGNAGIAAVNGLFGAGTLPSGGGALNSTQLTWLVNQLYNSSGNHTGVLAYSDPATAVDDIIHANTFYSNLQLYSNAGIAAVNGLFGAGTLPSGGGPLSDVQVTWLVNQLYVDATTRSAAYTDPATTVQDTISAYNLLLALQANAGFRNAFNGLFGTSISSSGLPSYADVLVLYEFLYPSGYPHRIYTNVTDVTSSVEYTDVIWVDSFLSTIRGDANLRTALNNIYGLIGADVFTANTGDGAAANAITRNQGVVLFGFLYDKDGV
ncbi:MAG: hypothetical protein NT145_06895, partial [Elusimicrobia bacterium]|nr:hypothetical protein [Elusimicrobiota bacterium]